VRRANDSSGDNAQPPHTEVVDARPWRGSAPPTRVLAIRLHALGDTVLTLPYLSALRRGLPEGATLDLLTREEVADIPKGVDLFDRVFEIGGGRSPRRQVMSAARMLIRLRMRRYQLVLDLQRNRISRMVRLALSPRAWSEFDRFSPRLAGERTRSTIEAAGVGPLDVRPDLVLRRPEAGLGKLRVAGWDGTSELVVLNPGGSFEGRRWPVESYVRFAELWNADRPVPAQFLTLGLPSTAAAARHMKDRLGDGLVDLVGRTTPDEAFALLHRAVLVLSEDSGLMHMAWVAGAPTLALFGASRGVWARPHGNYSAYEGVCERPGGACMDGRCRTGSPTCLERLAPEAVVDRARALVEATTGVSKRIYADGRVYAPRLEGGDS
jgi:ADP-heptose:LPS heptosyltransferase